MAFMRQVSTLVVTALLLLVAIQVATGGAQLEAVFEAGVIVGAGLISR
jgi:hypothetical protein